ncbi:MAG TPA: S26 family signal peptidase [Candidatus Brocadiia bacterium]|nr:S26 family signal peptidase [Candidatus Brocadiia bacterium]
MKRAQRRRGALRDNIEAAATAIVLALVIRHYVFEAFQIPTGSMAPTLVGESRTLVCPNCGLRFTVDHARPIASGAFCPNCRYLFGSEEIALSPCRSIPSMQFAWLQWALSEGFHSLSGQAHPFSASGGGNRILVNKLKHDFSPPQRWDVVVFRFPWAQCNRPSCPMFGRTVIPLRVTPARCPRCGGGRIAVTRPPGAAPGVEESRCQDCGWREPTRQEDARCPECGGPLVERNYIKRLIGLPGERLLIRHGDIFINGQIARKTGKAQDAMWRAVYDSSLPSRLPNFTAPQAWAAASGRVEQKDGELRVTPAGAAAARASFARPITDYTPYNGCDGGDIPVADIKVEMDLDLSASFKAFTIQIGEDENLKDQDRGCVYELRVAPAGEGRVSLGLAAAGVALGQPQTVDAGPSARLAFWHVDQAVGVAVDGQTVLTRAFTVPPEKMALDCTSSRLSLVVEGGELRATRVRIWRDTYYRHDLGQALYATPPDGHLISPHGYFMMGDNSRSSADSRMWGEVPADFVTGPAFVVWWPIDDIREVR